MRAKKRTKRSTGGRLRGRRVRVLDREGSVSRPPKAICAGDSELEATRERLRVISRVTGKIVGTESLVERARGMAAEVQAVIGMDACVIRLVDGQDLVLLACSGVSPDGLLERVPVDWGISREIFSLRQPIFIPDVRRHPRIARLRNRTPGGFLFTSYAGTPLLMGNEIIGLFGLYSHTKREDITAADLDYLRIFGNSIVVVMVNERLYGEVKRHRDQLTAEIAERRRAEEALRVSEERYRRVVEDQTEFVVRWKPDGTLTFVNDSYCRYFGKTRAELVGHSFIPLVAGPDRERVERSITSFTPREPVQSDEHRVILPDGRTGWNEWTNRAIFDDQGRLVEFQSVGRDSTERKRLQERLARASKMESIGTLAGGIAHDFGNVLAVILGNVSILQREPALSARVNELLAEMATAAERGSAFTRQLLAYAHGTVRQSAALDLNAVIHSVVGLLQRLKPKGVELVLDLAPNLPAVFGDSTQLEQVVLNLGLNAVEASLASERVELATARQTLAAAAAADLEITPGEYVIFRVADHGQGIREEVRDRIFELFFTTKPMGRGMGLATTLAIIRDHHGQIRVESKPNTGTTVTVWLPAIANPGGAIPATKQGAH